MKRILKTIISTALITALLAGCGGSEATTETSETPAEDKTVSNNTDAEESVEEGPSGKITLSAWDVESSPYIEQVIEAFTTENPNIEVEIIDILAADYTNKLSIDLNGGAASDVIFVKDGDTIFSLNKKNQLADLSSYIERDSVDLDLYNGLAENFAFDGKQVGLPIRTDYYILYYNKDIFDAAGVDYPSNDMTWSEFEELAKKVTYGEGQDKVYGAYLHTWQALVQNWAVQNGSDTIMGPDYEFMKDTYEMALRMQNQDKTTLDYATAKTASIHYSGVFQNGQAAMLPMGTWFISSMINAVANGESTVNWGIATIPHPDGTNAGQTVGSTTPITINEACENKDAAWELVKFFTSEKGAEILSQSGQFPGSLNEDLLATITSTDGMPEGAGEALVVSEIILDRPIVEYVNEVNQMLGEEHSLIMLGEVSVEDGLAEMGERSKEIQEIQ